MKDNLSKIKNQLLVMAARDGDKEAMKKLVLRWQKKLRQYVFKLTSDSQVTWDITQQCWLQMIKGIKNLNDPACFQAWAYRIATNKSIDWLKNKSKDQHINLDSVEVDCYQKNDDLRVKELVQRLKNDSRAVLCLYYFEQLSISEISIALNIPQGTVKSRLFKARGELKQLYEECFDN